jgi:histidinol phosphatase-like PHP family hydrolase
LIDLHTHTIFSDGQLIPSELARYAAVTGYRAIAITDHGDHSNLDFIIPRIVTACRVLAESHRIPVIPGIELTFVPPEHIGDLAKKARDLGAQIVVVHGETIVEPVIPGTNRTAVRSSVDILAHPGLITADEAALAAERGVCLEITTRRGHSLTNGHVARMAREAGAPLVLNTDSHLCDDLVTDETARRIAAGAGLADAEIAAMFTNSERLVLRVSRGC